jgi:hypothetical protein
MSIGASISVVALGAILSFATHVHSPGLNIAAVGAVLMAVGVVALVMQLAALARQRELTAVTATRRSQPVLVRPNEAVVDATPTEDFGDGGQER